MLFLQCLIGAATKHRHEVSQCEHARYLGATS